MQGAGLFFNLYNILIFNVILNNKRPGQGDCVKEFDTFVWFVYRLNPKTRVLLGVFAKMVLKYRPFGKREMAWSAPGGSEAVRSVLQVQTRFFSGRLCCVRLSGKRP